MEPLIYITIGIIVGQSIEHVRHKTDFSWKQATIAFLIAISTALLVGFFAYRFL